jgi:hypothetical protein
MSKRLLSILLSVTLIAGCARAQIKASGLDTFPKLVDVNRSENVSKVPIRSLLYEANQTKIFVHFMGWFGQANHIDVGYSSQDLVQIRRQIADIKSRGFDGIIFLWPGPKNTFTHTVLQLMIPEIEAAGLQFIVMLEDGSIKWYCKTGCDKNVETAENMNYILRNFATSPAYYRHNGLPVLMDFGLETQGVDLNYVRSRLGPNAWLRRNSEAFNQNFAGAFSWGPTFKPYPSSGYDYEGNFHLAAEKYPYKLEMADVYKGFDDVLASWSEGRILSQECGLTWIDSFKKINDFHNAGNPLEMLQVVTWNDYEEGTEIETGIDNCLSISTPITDDKLLKWTLMGTNPRFEETIDHLVVMNEGLILTHLPATARQLELSSLNLVPGRVYSLSVGAIGRPSIRNRVSGSVAYQAALQAPSVALTAIINGPIVQVQATGTTKNQGKQILTMISYVDSVRQTTVTGPSMAVSFLMPAGVHKVTVNAWDGSGLVGSTTISVTTSNPTAVKILP